MADIVKKSAGQFTKWDPLRATREMLNWDPFRMNWDPFREMAPFAAFQAFEPVPFSPSFDVTENKDAFLFKADVPGMKKEDIEITITGNRLQISGKRDSEIESKTDTVYTYERQYGSFCRSFTLPEGVDLDNVKSELKDGVLTLAVPKKLGAQAKKIPIATGVKS